MASRAAPAAIVPRGFLAVAGAAVAACIAAAAWSRLNVDPAPQAEPPALAQRLLRFEDQADGRIRVSDAATGSLVQMIEGEAGFARGTLRSLMRERRRREVALDLPLSLQARQDGHLVLSDPATGERIDLDAFGPTNAGVYARMLQVSGEQR